MSSIFVESIVDGEFKDSLWHPGFSLLAALTKDNKISLLNIAGSQIDETQLDSISDSISILKWHPTRKILAFGTFDGSIGIWDIQESSLHDYKSHQSCITDLRWELFGNCLISADQSGGLAIWNNFNRGKVSLIERLTLLDEVIEFRCLSDTKADFGIATKWILLCKNGSFHEVNGAGETKALEVSGGTCREIFTASSVRNDDSTITFFILSKNGVLSEFCSKYSSNNILSISLESQVKLSINELVDKSSVAWISSNSGDLFLCTGIGAQSTKIWDIRTQSCELLNIDATEARITSVCLSSKTIACAASNGVIHFFHISQRDDEFACVRDEKSLKIGFPIQSISCGPVKGLLSVSSVTGSLKILNEHQPIHAFDTSAIVFQKSHDTFHIQSIKGESTNIMNELKISRKTKTIKVCGENILVTDGTIVEIYERSSDLSQIKLASTFSFDFEEVCMDEKSIYFSKDSKIFVANKQGIVKQTVSLENSIHGTVVKLELSESNMLVVTNNNYVISYDTSRREIKSPVDVKNLSDFGYEEVNSVGLDSHGQFLSVVGTCKGKSTKYISFFDTQSNNYFEFSTEPYSKSNIEGLLWDQIEPKIIYVVMEKEDEKELRKVFCLFLSPNEKKAHIYDVLHLPAHDFIVAAVAPYLFRVSEGNELCKTSLLGVEVDADQSPHLLKFIYNVTVNEVEEALKIIANIKEPHIWEKIIHIAIRNKKVDLVKMCFGMNNDFNALKILSANPYVSNDDFMNLSSILAGKTNSKNMEEDSLSKYAVLLGSHGEDQLSKYESKILESFSKEQEGDYFGAVELLDTISDDRFLLPKVFFHADAEFQTECAFEGNVLRGGLKSWLGRYQESVGNFDKALQTYQDCKDYSSMIRVYCSQNRIQDAIDTIDKSKDPLAAYILAKSYESRGSIIEAINYYNISGSYRNSIRLAKDNDLTVELLQLALKSPAYITNEAANYFHETGQFDKAVILFEKLGNLSKALEICLEFQDVENLSKIVLSGVINISPKVFQQCSEILGRNQKYESLVHLYVSNGLIDEAIDQCSKYHIQITEELAEKMTNFQAESSGDGSERTKNRIIAKIAECCMEQGAYHVACKKYAQIGQWMNAMKSLLKTGDTERIIFFANVAGSKSKEIYVIAANYLQTVDWKGNSEIVRAIIGFYTKAKAFESLAIFYDLFAQIEIDEYQDYEKAMSAMTESLSLLQKWTPTSAKIRDLEDRLKLIGRFIATMQNADPAASVKEAYSLLSCPGLEAAVRRGDIYGFCIKRLAEGGQMAEAFQMLTKMKTEVSNHEITYYLEPEIIEMIQSEAQI